MRPTRVAPANLPSHFDATVRFVSTTDLTPPTAMRRSPLARAAFIATITLIVYGSLTPWWGWVDRGLSPWAYLSAPLPRYVTGFDLFVNVLAYTPFGVLGVLALYPRLRGVAAVVPIVVGGTVLSACMEALQTYLPQRVSSNIDLVCNALGVLAGAALVAPYASSVIDRGRLLELRARWFDDSASHFLLLLFLWPLVQFHPTPMLFGAGMISGAAEPLRALLALQALPTVFQPGEFMLAEAFVVFMATLATGLAFAAIQRPGSPRFKLVAWLMLATLVAKMLAYGNRLGPERALVWLTPGAVAGLLLAATALALALSAPRRAQLHGALVCALLWVVAVNVVPPNPYAIAFARVRRSLYPAYVPELLQWLAVAWPWLLALALGVATAASWRRPRAR